MREIKVLSYGKINLSIDVGKTMDSGFHQVDMIMQQLAFHDDVRIRYMEDSKKTCGDIRISLTTNRYYLPVDNRNLAYKAAGLMIDAYGKKVQGGQIKIDILKRIPVAAGLAGGSGNGAAVLHGLNSLWDLGLSLKELCELGSKLGSDVPFCVIGQAKRNNALDSGITKDSLATSCARATGTGTEIEPLRGLKKFVVIAKPAMGVSTKEVYQNIDKCSIGRRPDNDEISKALSNNNTKLIYKNMINVLEEYTLQAYPEVKLIKDLLEKTMGSEKVLMSGSGPTVFALYGNLQMAKDACSSIREKGYEAYWTRTTK